MRTRCTNCRDYFPKGTEWWSNSIQRICSEECFNEYTESKRAKKRTPKRYSKKRLERTLQPELRYTVTDRDKVCRICSRSAHEVHHILFRSQGGKNELSNLIFLCTDCHHNKAHGPDAKIYAQLFRAYLWTLYVTGRRMQWDNLVDMCQDYVEIPFDWSEERLLAV